LYYYCSCSCCYDSAIERNAANQRRLHDIMTAVVIIIIIIIAVAPLLCRRLIATIIIIGIILLSLPAAAPGTAWTVRP
jgi:uncharacterized membrane protein YhaH (DUF805 family)